MPATVAYIYRPGGTFFQQVIKYVFLNICHAYIYVAPSTQLDIVTLSKMVDAAAVIRPYNAEDRKLVQFMVGKSNMESLGVANNRSKLEVCFKSRQSLSFFFSAYFHPITLSVWFGLSAVFIQLMSWWPTEEFGFWSYLRAVCGFATMAVPILAFVDWYCRLGHFDYLMFTCLQFSRRNRPDFEELTQEVVRYEDLRNIPRYYKDPASGVFIFDMGDTYIGFIAIDAMQSTNGDRKGPKTAVIRHFHVDERFRKINAQKDLLNHAVCHAFDKDRELQRIQATDSPLLAYQGSCLRAYGFELDHHTKTVGIQKWKMGVRYLERERWAQKEKAVKAG